MKPKSQYIAEQIFMHVSLKGGEGNPFRAISMEWFAKTAAPKIAELLGGDESIVEG